MNVTWTIGIEKIRDTSFLKKWHDCFEKCIFKNVFFSPELSMLWLEMHQEAEPHFLLIEDANGMLLWPLCIQKYNRSTLFRRLLCAVGNETFDYAEPLCTSKDVNLYLDVAIEAIRVHSDFDKADISGILTSSPRLKKEAELFHINTSSYVDEEDFLAKSKKSLREDVRRCRRMLGELGEITCEKCDVKTALEEFPCFLNFHDAKWGGSQSKHDFICGLLKFADTLVSFDCLRLNGKSIAWYLSFHCAGYFYCYMPVFDPEYFKVSPSKTLTFYLVSRSIQRGDSCFDLLRGNEKYKSAWAKETHGIYSFVIYRHTLLSSLRNVWVEKVTPFLKKWL